MRQFKSTETLEHFLQYIETQRIEAKDTIQQEQIRLHAFDEVYEALILNIKDVEK